MSSYVALCQRGGEAAFGELIRSADLRSPFEAGCLMVKDVRRLESFRGRLPRDPRSDGA